MNVGLSDHQLIYCTRKISRVKTGSMVLVISLWRNILYKNREPTLWFWKVIVRCAWRFYFRTFVPYLCQQHASGLKIKFIFICRCLMFHGIEKQLNKNFENVCDWFVDNKLSIHIVEDKTKSILSISIKSKVQEN